MTDAERGWRTRATAFLHDLWSLADLTFGYEAFRPPKRATVAEAVAENLFLVQPGAKSGYWDPSETPYMAEPMNMLASRSHEAVVFVGPARTGKTAALLLGGVTYAVLCDPGDIVIIQMSQEKAREFSRTDIDRAIRNSPNLRAMLGGRQDDNTHDKGFRNGVWLRIGWPTISQLSGSTYRYGLITDRDRIDDDIDGEGDVFIQVLKRTTTFRSRGMCAVESSPGRLLEDPNWTPATPHEAPPVNGVLGIYNRSDRRRWYWPCPYCDEYFEAEPGLGLFNLPELEQLEELVRTANLDQLAEEYSSGIWCPCCGLKIEKNHKYTMNSRGRWVAEWQSIKKDGTVVGEVPRASTAGYWLGGVAAAYQSWHSLVLRYLQALREYVLTASDEALKVTVTTDQGLPYTPIALVKAAKESGATNKDEFFERYVVTKEARFVIASVDVQAGTHARFVVQVHAVGPFMEQWLIDRYAITESRREGVGSEFAPIDPGTYAEDWDLLTERVLHATYRTTVNGKEMRVKMLGVDTGGEDGVTENAYSWFRRLRAEGLHGRVRLIKGASQKTAPPFRLSMVGGKNSKVSDIPLWLVNPNYLKDGVAASLRRAGGPSALHLPNWLPASFFDEYKAEVKRGGIWVQIKPRNEALDCSAYIRAVLLMMGVDKILEWDSDSTPAWARGIDTNPEVITREERRQLQADAGIRACNEPRARRVVSSKYLRQ